MCSLSNLANRPWPQAPIDSRGMLSSPCAKFDSVVELLSTHPIIEQFPGLLHLSHSVISSALLPRPPQIFTCDIAESSISKSPIPLPELYALAIDRLHERQLLEASSMNSCIAVPPASRKRNTGGSTTRTRFQHPTAHPLLKTAYHLQRLSLHPFSHTETNAFNEIPISPRPHINIEAK